MPPPSSLSSLTPKPPSASSAETTHLVLPGDTNTHGTAFGGKIMQWMDIIAGIASGRHACGPVVTVAVDELIFDQPIRMGDVVTMCASVNFTGRSSMEVGVKVSSERIVPGNTEPEQRHCLSGYFTFVAVDDAGSPIAVAPIAPQSESEKRHFEAGKERRTKRLKENIS